MVSDYYGNSTDHEKRGFPSYAEFDNQESLKMRIEDYSSILNLVYHGYMPAIMGR
jgi:hypothetical protein